MKIRLATTKSPRSRRLMGVLMSVLFVLVNLPSEAARGALSNRTSVPDAAVVQDLPGDAVLLAFLNTLEDKVRSLMDHAGAVANTIVIRAGSEVDAEINNFKNAYEDMLNKTIKELNKTMTAQLAQVNSDVTALENKTAQDAERLAVLATQGANILPLANKIPQLTFIDPSYEVAPAAGTTDTFTIFLRGNFVQAASPGFEPHVTVNGNSISPSMLTTQKLAFVIPRSILSPSGHATSFVEIPIVVPYKTGFLGKKKDATFKAYIVGLPPSPGKLTLFNTVETSTPNRSQVRTTQDNMQSDRDDHEEVRCGPNESRTINPNSVRVVFERTEGDSWSYHPVRVNNPSVCFWFRTEHHGVGTSDKLWWHYEYEVTFTDTGTRTDQQDVPLKWGDSRSFPFPAGQFKLVFDGFDGTHQEFLQANHNNRYIDVSNEGGGLVIAARPVVGILPIQGGPNLFDILIKKKK
jgi:hypothetical protein